MQFDKKQFIRDSSWLYSSSAIVSIAGLLTSIITARLLDADLFGIFTIITILITLVENLSIFGLNTSLVYYLSKNAGNKTQEKEIFSDFLKYKLLIIAIISIALFAIAPILANILNIQNGDYYIRMSIFYFIAFAFSNFIFAAYNGLSKFKKISIWNAASNVLKLSLVTIALFYGFKIGGTLVAMAISLFCISGILFFKIKNMISIKNFEKLNIKNNLHFFKYGLYVWLSEIGGEILVWTDSIMLSIILNPTIVGFYKIAESITWMIAGFVTSGLRQILLPTMIKLNSDIKNIENFSNQLLKNGLFLSLPCAFGLLLVARPLIQILYGTQYLAASVLLNVFSFFLITALLLNVLANITFSFGKPNLVSEVYWIMILINVPLNLVFIPVYGAMGAAIASFISWVAGIVVIAHTVNRDLKVSLNCKNFINPLVASALMFVIMMNFTQYASGLLGLTIFILAAVIIYIPISAYFGFPIKKLAKIVLRLE